MEQRLIQEKIEQEDQPAGCTFHPQINPQSEKILAESLRRTASGDDDFSGFDEDNPLIERLPLYERAAIIDKENREKLNKMRIESELNNEELTYNPAISKQTNSIIRKSLRLGPDFLKTPVVERLEKERVCPILLFSSIPLFSYTYFYLDFLFLSPPLFIFIRTFFSSVFPNFPFPPPISSN